MRPAPGWLLIPASASALALSACQAPVAPGDPVGVYAVSGQLEENTCGRTALPASDALEFSVELRQDDEQGHWLVDGELPGFEGDLDAEGQFLFGVEQVSEVSAPGTQTGPNVEQPQDYFAPDLDPQPQTQGGQAGCQISIIETIEGKLYRRLDADGEPVLLDSGDEALADDLEANNRIELAPMPGSNCRASLAVEGGPFLALPCYARYTLRGALSEE